MLVALGFLGFGFNGLADADFNWIGILLIITGLIWAAAGLARAFGTVEIYFDKNGIIIDRNTLGYNRRKEIDTRWIREIGERVLYRGVYQLPTRSFIIRGDYETITVNTGLKTVERAWLAAELRFIWRMVSKKDNA